MKKYDSATAKNLFISIIMLAFFATFIIAVNFIVDPANLAGSSYEREIAKIMSQGKNVTNIENYDDRELIKQYLEISENDIDTIAIGSSRCMQMTKEAAQCEKFFSAGVTGAELRDCINIYYSFKNAGKQPKKVILFTEYWFLSKGNLDERASVEEYGKFCKSINSPPFKTKSRKTARLKELFSFTYFQKSVQYALKDPVRAHVQATDEADGKLATRRADGSYSYEESYRLAGEEYAMGKAKEYTIRNTIQLNFTGVDKTLCFQFEKFIEKMQEDGVEVELVISPFHPIAYEQMQKSAKYVDILPTEEYFRLVAKKYDI
ncbi:MAG: hypothetical protein RR198_07245, partial [Oscillospiraceae bacterium]